MHDQLMKLLDERKKSYENGGCGNDCDCAARYREATAETNTGKPTEHLRKSGPPPHIIEAMISVAKALGLGDVIDFDKLRSGDAVLMPTKDGSLYIYMDREYIKDDEDRKPGTPTVAMGGESTPDTPAKEYPEYSGMVALAGVDPGELNEWQEISGVEAVKYTYADDKYPDIVVVNPVAVNQTDYDDLFIIDKDGLLYKVLAGFVGFSAKPKLQGKPLVMAEDSELEDPIQKLLKRIQSGRNTACPRKWQKMS